VEAANTIVKGQAEEKATFQAHMERQMRQMIELTSTWRTVRAEVAAAEKVLESTRVQRIKAQQSASDYFMDTGCMCVFRQSVRACSWETRPRQGATIEAQSTYLIHLPNQRHP
jgi:hypothetical protein